MKTIAKQIILILALLWGLISLSQAATSITYKGITWTFSADKTVGTFVTGEPYVVGPVTVTAISPATAVVSGRSINGSMKNVLPNTTQGFDNAWNGGYGVPTFNYDSSKNIALSLPASLVAGDTMLSSISYTGSLRDVFMQTICALTVVSSSPAAGSFRPSIWGTSRTIRYNSSSINWTLFKNLPATAATPTKAQVLAMCTALPWIEWSSGFNGFVVMPLENTAEGGFLYGRSIGSKFGTVLLWLNTNQPLADKQEVALNLIQNGIDIYEYLQQPGSGFYHDGGHKCGRKLPLVVAAAMLGASDLTTKAGTTNIFQEDQQLWYVTQSDVGRALEPETVYPFENYTQSHVGLPEWGVRHRYEPKYDNASWGAGYRSTVGDGQMGSWMAIELMGLQSTWNYPVSFAYMRRYRSISGTGGWGSVDRNFAASMWQYIGAPVDGVVSPSSVPPAGNYSSAQTVALSTSTSGATIRYTTDGSTPTSSVGTVYSSPLAISANTTLKAIAYKATLTDSSVVSSTYTFSDYATAASSQTFVNVPFTTALTTSFTAAWDATPSGSAIDGVMGISNGDAAAFSQLACIVRFNTSGVIDARNGAAYAAVNTQSYTGSTSYHFSLAVDMVAKTYDLTVTPSGGSPVVIANDYAFRTEQVAVGTLNNLALSSPTGSLTADNFEVTPVVADPPAEAPAYNVVSGNYTTAQTVTLSSATPSASIRYEMTTNGSDPATPTVSSSLYSTPLVAAAGLVTNIKAVAFASGYTVSPVASARYSVDSVVVPPTTLGTPQVDIAGGDYASTQAVTPSSIAGASIYYTTNGSTPTTGSTLYVSGTITISANTVLKLFAVKSGYLDSAAVTHIYVIGGGAGGGTDIPPTSSPTFTTIALPATFTNRSKIVVQVAISNSACQLTGGLCAGTPVATGELSASWRTHDGFWRAHQLNGTYAAVNSVAITAEVWQIEYTMNRGSYSMRVKAPTGTSGAWVTIATNYKVGTASALTNAAYLCESHGVTVDLIQASKVFLIH